MDCLFTEPGALLRAANIAIPAGQRRPEMTAALQQKMDQTFAVVVNLRTLLVTKKTSKFGTGRPFWTPNEADRPQSLRTLAIALVDFIERMHATRKMRMIVFAIDNPAHQHPFAVAEHARVDPLPYSRRADALGFVPLVLLNVRDNGDLIEQVTECAIGTCVGHGGLLLDDILGDRRIAPLLYSLVFQLVTRELVVRKNAGGADYIKDLRVVFAGAVYHFGRVCKPDTNEALLPNSVVLYEREAVTDTISSFFSLPDAAAAMNATIASFPGSQNRASQVELLWDENEAVAASLLFYERGGGAAILWWRDDECIVDMHRLYAHHIPTAMRAAKIPERPMDFLFFAMTYFGGVFMPPPLGFERSAAKFKAGLALTSVLIALSEAPPAPTMKFHDESAPGLTIDGNAALTLLFKFMVAMLEAHGIERAPSGADPIKHYLGIYIDKALPVPHPLRDMIGANAAAYSNADIDFDTMTVDRLRGLSITLLQQIASGATAEPVEKDWPHPESRARGIFLRRFASFSVAIIRHLQGEEDRALKITRADPADGYNAIALREEIDREIAKGLPDTHPCPLEINAVATSQRVSMIASAIASLAFGHLGGARRTARTQYDNRDASNAVFVFNEGRNGGYKTFATYLGIQTPGVMHEQNLQWTEYTRLPVIDSSIVFNVAGDSNHTDTYAPLLESGLPIFANIIGPATTVADALLFRRALMLDSDAISAATALLTDSEERLPHAAVPVALRAFMASQHAAAPRDAPWLEIPLSLSEKEGSDVFSFFPTVRVPEIDTFCMPNLRSRYGSGLFLPFSYDANAAAQWAAALEPTPATGPKIAMVPVALFTEDGAASAVVYHEANDYDDAVQLASTALYLESLQAQCRRRARIPEHETLSYLLMAPGDGSPIAQLGAIAPAILTDEMKAAGLVDRLLSFSADVITYAMPMLGAGIPDEVWAAAYQPNCGLFRAPMEAAHQRLCAWKVSEITAASAMTLAAAGGQSGAAWRAALYGLAPIYGDGAAAAAAAMVSRVPLGDWPTAEVHGSWCGAAMALHGLGAAPTKEEVAEAARATSGLATYLSRLLPVPSDARVRLVRSDVETLDAEVLIRDWPFWAAIHLALHVSATIARTASATLEAFVESATVAIPPAVRVGTAQQVQILFVYHTNRQQ